MKNNEYNLNNIYVVFILVFCVVFCPVVIAGNNNDNSSLYAVIKVSGKEKLYTKGDILYSRADITECFRIQEIDMGFLILKDLNSKDSFKIELGQAIPLKGSKKVFKKAVKIEL